MSVNAYNPTLRELTSLENFSFTHYIVHSNTASLSEKLPADASKIKKTLHEKIKPIVIRIVCFVCVPFSSLIDVSVHAGLFMGKAIVVALITPFKYHFQFSKDLDAISPFIHLTRAAHSVAHVVFLPFIALWDPYAANSLTIKPIDFNQLG